MLIDCTTCVARDLACDDCVITVLLASPPLATRPPRACSEQSDILELDDADRAAFGNLASAGLVPPLRLVAALPAVAGAAVTGPAGSTMSGKDREIA